MRCVAQRMDARRGAQPMAVRRLIKSYSDWRGEDSDRLRAACRVCGSRTKIGAGLLAADRRLCRCEAGDRYAEWRAADVVEADSVEEGDRGWVAAVFAADADLDVWPH